MPTSARTRVVFTSLLGLPSVARVDSAVLFVDGSAASGGDGQSWGSAHRFLSDAIAAAAIPGSGVDEIRIAQGSYAPDHSAAAPSGTGDRNATFQMLGGVAYRGGYAGLAGPNPNARDIAAYATILDGDLPGDDLPNWVHHDNNAFHVVSAIGIGAGAQLDGLIVRGGHAGFPAAGTGGGIVMLNASPTLTDCTFDQCFGTLGGAVHCDGGDPVFANCEFNGNYVSVPPNPSSMIDRPPSHSRHDFEP